MNVNALSYVFHRSLSPAGPWLRCVRVPKTVLRRLHRELVRAEADGREPNMILAAHRYYYLAEPLSDSPWAAPASDPSGLN